MDKEIKGIRSEAIKMAWFSRGSLQYNDALNLSRDERQIYGELIKENMDTTKKSGLNFF